MEMKVCSVTRKAIGLDKKRLDLVLEKVDKLEGWRIPLKPEVGHDRTGHLGVTWRKPLIPIPHFDNWGLNVSLIYQSDRPISSKREKEKVHPNEPIDAMNAFIQLMLLESVEKRLEHLGKKEFKSVEWEDRCSVKLYNDPFGEGCIRDEWSLGYAPSDTPREVLNPKQIYLDLNVKASYDFLGALEKMFDRITPSQNSMSLGNVRLEKSFSEYNSLKILEARDFAFDMLGSLPRQKDVISPKFLDMKIWVPLGNYGEGLVIAKGTYEGSSR
ncbi:MAG: hypothetical protein ABIF88_02665 [archaeon]